MGLCFLFISCSASNVILQDQPLPLYQQRTISLVMSAAILTLENVHNHLKCSKVIAAPLPKDIIKRILSFVSVSDLFFLHTISPTVFNTYPLSTACYIPFLKIGYFIGDNELSMHNSDYALCRQ